MKKGILAALLTLVIIGSSGVAYGHHSFAAFFTIDELVTIKGVVTEFVIINPHSLIHLDVTNEENTVEKWVVVGGSRNVYIRAGITQETIKPGTVVTIDGNPSREGLKLIGLKSLVTDKGEQIWPPLK